MSLGVTAEQRTPDGVWHRTVTDGAFFATYETARLGAEGWSAFRIVRTFSGETAHTDAYRWMSDVIAKTLYG